MRVFVGQLAQLVEQRIENPRVRGSIPRLATRIQAQSPFFGVGFLLSGVRYRMAWRGVLQIFDAGSACRGLHGLPLAIRQGCLHGRHQVAAMGVSGALCLCGIGCPVVLLGKTTTYPWWVHPVGVLSLYAQGRRCVA